jgi:hypothetical protein
MLTECSMSWDDLQPAAEGPTWWATSIYRLISPDPAAGPAATGTSNSGEVDFFEYQVGGGGPDPRLSFFYGPQGASSSLYISSIRAAWGPYKWHTAKQYANATMVVAYNGVIYISSRATIGEQPDISPTAWSVLTATAAGYPADWVAFDFEAQNTYSVLWIPYVRGDLGHLLTFSNDICCPRGHAAYGPVLRNVPGPGVPLNAAPFYTNDGQAFPMMIGTSSNLNTYTDWVRIIK